MKKLLAITLALSMLCTACTGKVFPTDAPKSFESSVAFTADLHYITQDDPKTNLLAQRMLFNQETIDALLFDCKKNNTDTLLILGDLTNMGQKAEHAGIIAKLQKAKDEGLDIYVIPGGYDFQEITPDEFENLYANFGYNKALSQDPSSASYSVMIKDKLVLMLDTVIPIWEYSGEIRTQTLAWLEEQLIYAKDKGLNVITASHNTLVNHVPEGLPNPYDMLNGELLTELLNKYDVKLHLSGFRHARQVNSFGSGYEIMIDMPIFYPNAYGMLYFNGNSVDFVPTQIDVTGYAKKAKLHNEHLRNFNNYSKRALQAYAQQNGNIELLDKGLTEKETKEALKTYVAAEEGRAAGTLYQNNAALLQSEGYKIWQSKLSTTRYGRWMPVWLTECNDMAVGFSTEF